MTRILVATRNPGKLREFEEALAPEGIEIVGLDALADAPIVRETGSSFDENARIKAEACSARTDLPVLADDSGLEVDALGGEPGVRSARYGGEGLDDAGRCRLVIDKLAGVPRERRRARFRCALALARGGRTIADFEGTVEGFILEEPRGENGFGYDPIFFHEGAGRTFAELSRAEKRALSHRGRALDGVRRYWRYLSGR